MLICFHAFGTGSCVHVPDYIFLALLAAKRLEFQVIVSDFGFQEDKNNSVAKYCHLHNACLVLMVCIA